MKLTQKQKRFVQEYLICLNATEAAKRAGYSARVANVIGYENLKKPKIQQAIEETLSIVSSNKISSIQEILEFLTAGMRGELTEEIPLFTEKGKQSFIDKQLNCMYRIRCAELLGKRYGLFSDKFQLEGNLPVILVGEDNLED